MNSLQKYLLLIFVSLLSLGGIFFYQSAEFNDGKLHLVFCNVGQGDGIFIRTPKGNDILIDGGPNDSILNCLNNHMPFWDRDIELVILTHPHADHLVGLIAVLERYNVMEFASQNLASSSEVYQELTRTLKTKNIKQKTLFKGDKFTSSNDLILTTKWPNFSSIAKTTDQNQAVLGSKTEYFAQNESSLIELLSFGNFDVLLTGDSEVGAEEEAMSSIGQDIEVLKVSHHGSKTGTSKELLEIIRPELAVISVGKNNKYNLPYPKTLEVLKELGIKTLRTDENGEIEIVSDGEKWWAD